MKRKWISGLLILVLVFSLPLGALAADGTMVYTALGDSIAWGTGAAEDMGYTRLLHEHLERSRGEVEFNLMAEDGVTSEMLLYALSAPGDPEGAQAAVAGADLVTISIGGNDLLGPFNDAVSGLLWTHYFNGTYLAVGQMLWDLSQWEMNPASQPHITAMFQGLAGTLALQSEAFEGKWQAIIGAVRMLNPGAQVLVTTVFNPFDFSVRLYEMADPLLYGLNGPIWALADPYGYQVADVYGAFSGYGNPRKPLVGGIELLPGFMLDPDSWPVPLHPTDRGYRMILNLHKDLLN